MGNNFGPCRTPVWAILALDFTPLKRVTHCLPLMEFDNHCQAAPGNVDLVIFDTVRYESVLISCWEQVDGDTGQHESLHRLRC